MCKREDIYFVDFGENCGSSKQSGTRPVVIVGNNRANENSPVVTVVLLTARVTHVQIPLKIDSGLDKPSMAFAEQLETIDKKYLREQIGKIIDSMIMNQFKLLCRYRLVLTRNIIDYLYFCDILDLNIAEGCGHVRVEQIWIRHYRSIDTVLLKLPMNKPLILFGPNNAGKSNILSAIDRILGERFPTYIELQDSDYFKRDKKTYPRVDIACKFDGIYYTDKRGNEYEKVCLTYGYDDDTTKNLLHDCTGNQLYINAEQRSSIQSYLIDAERNIQSTFSYSSKYSMLSKFSHRIHEALSSDNKEALNGAFDTIKSTFESTDEFGTFFYKFQQTLKDSVKGFVHSLEVDFSAYDPNNYAKSMRIFAKEGEALRSFEEFGTGEQQVLLMAFVKSYMETFTSETFVLIIEEPEAHLHPLAQRWLKEYIYDLCKTGIQVIISTHSTEFIDAGNLDGMVRVYKEAGTTKTMQVDAKKLCEHCIECGAR